MRELLAVLPLRLSAHIALVLGALAIALVLALPLGVAVARSRRGEAWVLGAASVLQTIPGLALLAFMVPALAALGLRSIGALPALLALVVYAVLPILRNTVTGLRGVDPAVREAALGVGMTSRESLLRVELPLALPTIVAGVRTAAAWTVGTATLSTPVGATSLGDYIFAGLQTRQHDAVLVGCAAAAGLALALDGVVRLAERGVRSRRRGPLLLATAGLAVLLLAAAWPVLTRRGGGERPVLIGAKTFTEQYVLAEVLAQTVTARGGGRAETLSSLGSNVVFDALRSGAIDVYVDYSGTLWTAILHRSGDPPDREAMRRALSEELRARHGVHVLAALGFENTYALATTPAIVARHGLRGIGDLAPHAGGLRVGGDYEVFRRPEWRRVRERYALRFGEERAMDPALMFAALGASQVDVITAFSTDGRIASMGLTVLADDRRAMPPYDALLLASDRFVRTRPEAARALRALEGAIDADAMRAMNAAVDQRHRAPAVVAREFLARRR